MKRKGSFLLSLISILLVIAAVVGMVVMVDKIGDEFEKAEEEQSDTADKTPSGNGASDSGSDSGNNDSSGDGEQIDPELNYYINETTNTGFVVKGDKTIFFKKILPEWMLLSYVNETEEVECRALHVATDWYASYSNYDLLFWYSNNLNDWREIVFEFEDFVDGGKYSNT